MGGVVARTRAVGGTLGRVLGTLGGGLFGPLGAIVGGAITSQLGSIVPKFEELGAKIDAAAKNGRRLGIATETLMGLEGAAGEAGLSVEELTRFLMRARTNVAGDLWVGLQRIADRMQGMADPLAKANIVNAIFGEMGHNAVKFLTMFESGGQGLRDTVKAYQDFGYAVNDVDAGRIEAANDALQRLRFMFAGIMNKAVIAIAPAITTISQTLTKLSPVVRMVGDLFRSYWGGLAHVVGKLAAIAGQVFDSLVGRLGGGVATVVDLMDRAFDAVASVVEALGPIVVDLVSGALGKLLDWGADLFGWATGQMPTVEDVVVGAFRGIGLAGAYAFDAIVAGVGYVGVGLGKMMQWLGQGVKAVSKWVSHSLEATHAFRRGWYAALGEAAKPYLALAGVAFWWIDHVVTPVFERAKEVVQKFVDWFKPVMEAWLAVEEQVARKAGGEAMRQFRMRQQLFEKMVGAVEEKGMKDTPFTDLVEAADLKIQAAVKRAEQFGGWLDDAGKDVEAWGQNLADQFGQSADAVNAFFDGVVLKRRDVDKALGKGGGGYLTPTDYHATGAMIKGGAEEASIRARFQVQHEIMKPELELARQQLDVQRQMLDQLKRGQGEGDELNVKVL